MSHAEKSGYWAQLKEAGFLLEKKYQQYSTDELRKLAKQLPQAAVSPAPPPAHSANPAPTVPVARRNNSEMAGQRLNTHPEDEPIRQDPDTGFLWYQEEVLKPATAKPRGRRVIDYIDTGSVSRTFKEGGSQGFSESFEIPGQEQRAAQAKVTLPSYQVGIFRDPRTPLFRTIIYSGERGFHFEDVNAFFGSADLVPVSVKRKYVSNVLCYDIRSVISTIEAEARQLRLAGHNV